MPDVRRKELFLQKYQDVDIIWSGKSFVEYHDYKTLLSELPISEVAVPGGEYRSKFAGNLDYVYGELRYCLEGYEGYLRDKAFPTQRCIIRPSSRRDTLALEFRLQYQTNQGEERTWSCEVLRAGQTKFILFVSYYRPL
jgi:hypothetical protein